MNSKKYLVLGTGVGEAIAYMLAKSIDTHLIVVGDIDIERAIKVCNFVNKFSRSRCICTTTLFDVEKTQDHVAVFKKFDVVISALPAKYNLGLAEAAILADTNFCDLGGVVEITRKMLQLGNKYHNIKSSIVPDCGLMPGLGLIILLKLFLECSAQMLRPNSATIYVGGIPQKPKPPLFYQPMFCIEGLMHLCFDKAPIVRNGEIILADPFSEYEQIHVPELIPYSKQFNGTVEAFITAGTSIAPWYLQKCDIENFCEKTIRWPGFVEFVKPLTQDNFGEKMKATISAPIDENNPDLVWMKVELSGKDSNSTPWSRNVTLLDLLDPETGLTAMQRTTGFTTAIIAEMMTEGKTKPGVNTPENALDHSGLNEVIDRVSDLWYRLSSCHHLGGIAER